MKFLCGFFFLSLFLDPILCNLIEALPHGDLFNEWRDLSDFGILHLYIFALLALFAFARLKNAKELAEFCVLGLLNFALTGALVAVLKAFVGRIRPHVAGHFYNMSFDPMNLNHLHQSFPSGHTQTVFSFSFWLSLRYPRLRIPSLLFASVIASSRIARNVHFLSDVVAGVIVALLGLELSRWILKQLTAPNSLALDFLPDWPFADF